MNSAPTPADLPGVLVLVSNPHDAPVSIHADLAALREAVQDLPYAAAFTAGVAEVDAVADLLARRDRPRCRVLHFVGHGSPPDGDDDDGRLVFEQRSGAARGMDRATLAATLAPTGNLEFDLAILSACHSERIAATLTTLGVRHAVAIEADESVYEIAAVKFYGRFYRTLLTGGTVAEAFSAGCNAVRTDARLGGRAAGEVAKFRLLPAAGDHAVAIFPARVDGALVFHDLPMITQPNFDAPPVGFIGRGRDKLAVVEALAARRGVLLKGVSGIGKTATGREVSRWLAERGWCDPGHAYFVALRDAGNAADVRTALLLSLALPAGELPAGADAADKWLADRLPPRCLLLLDEAESAVHGGGLAVRNLLERLVASRSRPLVIVTSQVDVGSPALPVVELRRPPGQEPFLLFAAYAGLTLTELARLHRGQLEQVLRMVDGVPRAIELVARVWRSRRDPDLQPLLAEMALHQERILRDPSYPDEVKSVTLGVQLAYDRLRQRSVDAAEMFAQLSLFAGGVTVDGIAAIFGPGGREWLRLVEDQSLAERAFGELPAPFVLVYLPTPFRTFAARQLAQGEWPARATLGEAALRFYADLEDEPHTGWVSGLYNTLIESGEAMGVMVARIAAELPSIEAWYTWGCLQNDSRAIAVRSARIPANLYSYYNLIDRVVSLRQHFDLALATAQRWQDRRGEANVLQALGDLALREDELGEARRRYEAALAIYPVIGDRLGEANVLQALGDLALREDELGEARRRYEAALAIYPVIGARLGEANVLQALGDLALREDELGEARRRYEAALAIYPVIGARLGEANVQKALGDLALREAELGEARRRYEAALAIYPVIGARLGEANVQKALGDLALREDELGEARRRYEAALAIYPVIGDRLGEANVLQALGDLALREAELGEARRRYEAALAIYPVIGARLGEANVLQALGDLALREDELGEARRRYEAALAIYPVIGDRLGEANVLQALGDLALREAELGEARRRYEAALAIYPVIGARLGEANVQKALGDLALREAELGEARRRYEAALAIYPVIGARLGEANVLQALGDLALREAELGEARRRYEAALAIYPVIGARLGEANVLQALGDLALREDELGEARRRYEAALAIYPVIGDRLGEANVLQALGDLALREAELGEARRRYEAALAIYPVIGARLGEANVQTSLGNLSLAEGAIEDAFARFRQALAAHEAVGDRLGMAADLGYMGRAAAIAGAHAQAVLILDDSLKLLRTIGDRFGQIINLNDQGTSLWQLGAQTAALAAWWQAMTVARSISAPQVRNLEGLFANVAQQIGADAWQKLQGDLTANAEAHRQAGIDAARQALEEAQP